MNKFTVIGYNEVTGKVARFVVDAKNKSHAFWVAAQNNPNVGFIASLDGVVNEGEGLDFAGESVVSGETILEQAELFNPPTYNLAFTLAFEVPGASCKEGHELTPSDYKKALLQRLANLDENPSEYMEALGAPFDSYQEI